MWSDSDWEDERPPMAKRQRASPSNIEHSKDNDQAKLKCCPDILKAIVVKILLLDSLCGCFKSYGQFSRKCNGNFVEMFSGGPKGRAVSNGFRHRGWEGDDFDKDITDDHDFTTSFGFCATLLAVFRLSVADLLWTGLVCTSFCWVNRSTSQRNGSNNFLGDQTLKHVATGNLILYRNMLLLLMCQAAGVIIMLEQPLGSCMPQTPIFRSAWKFLRWNYVVVWLGAFGAESKKPIKVFAPVDWIAKLPRPILGDKKFVTLCTSKDGKHTGKSAALKNSQHYPQRFGAAVAAEFSANLGAPPLHVPSVQATNGFIEKHDWRLAKLDCIHAWLDKHIAMSRDAPDG